MTDEETLEAFKRIKQEVREKGVDAMVEEKRAASRRDDGRIPTVKSVREIADMAKVDVSGVSDWTIKAWLDAGAKLMRDDQITQEQLYEGIATLVYRYGKEEDAE